MGALFRKIGGEVRGLHQAAFLLGFFAILTQVLALLRDRIFAATFGAGEQLDIYYAAFKFPDLLFVIVATLLSVYVLVPFVTERLENKEELRRFMGSMMTTQCILLAFGSFVIFVTAPNLISWFFPGFSAEAMTDTVHLTRLLLIQVFVLTISNLYSSVTQTFRRFVIVAAIPLLYNLGIIIGAVAFYPRLGLSGLAWGAVLGAVLHLGLQLPFLAESGLSPSFARTRSRELKQVFILSMPRAAGLAAHNAALLAYASFASLLPAGSLAIFTFAYNLQYAPVTIIGLSYSVAAFSSLVVIHKKGTRDEFITEVIVAARHILFWMLPVTALLIVLRAHIVRVILGSGAFDWNDTKLTAAALAIFALSLAAHGILLLLVRAYYAAGNTRTPFFSTIASVPVGIATAYWLIGVLQGNEGFRNGFEWVMRVTDTPGTAALMLPLGYTVGIVVQALLLILFFRRDFGGFWAGIRKSVWQNFVSAFAGAVAAYAGLNISAGWFNDDTLLGMLGHGALGGTAGIAANVLVLYLMGSPELRDTWHSLHHKFWRAKTIVPTEEEGDA